MKGDETGRKLAEYRREEAPAHEMPRWCFRTRGYVPALSHVAPQHFLNLLPLPHGQGSLRPTFRPVVGAGLRSPASRRP